MGNETTRNFKILIVEDDIVDAKLLKRQLTQSNLNITVVKHAEYLKDALSELRNEKYDVVLLDMNLPDSNGIETLNNVSKEFPQVTIINVTGGTDETVALKAVASGAQDYLVKGRFDPYVLEKSIRYSIERKKTERQLRESTGKLDAMLGAISDHMTMVDKSLTVIWANNAAKQTFGENIIGKKCFEIYHQTESCPKVHECVLRKSLEDGKVHYWDTEITTKDGECRFFHSTANVALWDSEGKPEAVIEISRDITKTKLAEKDIIATNQELENANQELKEMQSQVVQNEKLASIGQLAAGVAHEMNTPVGFVASNFSTLRKYVDRFTAMLSEYQKLVEKANNNNDEKYKDELTSIKDTWDELKMEFVQEDIQELFTESKEGLDRVTSIIQNLRDFSRVDQATESTEYDLNGGIEATLTVARNEIKYDADVTTDFCDNLPVKCNASQVNQVFLNIIVNAAQAIKSQEREGKGNINIKTYIKDKWGVCEIVDDGPGIPEDVINKVFDPFFTTKPVGKGTGLGLNVSYDIIVNKHKGQLTVDSEVGKGTKFTIKLPLATAKIENKEELLVGAQTDGK